MNIESHNDKQAIQINCDSADEYLHIKNMLEVERRKLLNGSVPKVQTPVLTLYDTYMHISKQPFNYTLPLSNVSTLEFTRNTIQITGESGELHEVILDDVDLFGQELEKVRITKGYSLNDVAAVTGINKGTISKYERDLIPITKSHLAMLQRVFNTPQSINTSLNKSQVKAQRTIEEAMTKLDITASDIAEHIGVSKATAYSMIKYPKLNAKILKLCLLLQINVWDVIDIKEVFGIDV